MEQKTVVLNINGIDYIVKTIISLEIIFIIISKENSEKDFERRVAEAILSALQIDDINDKPFLEDILKNRDRIFYQYINAVICDNEDVINYYSKRSETESLCERFCQALVDYTQESMAEFSKHITALISQTYQPITDILSSLGEKIQKAYVPTFDISRQFTEVAQNIINFSENINQVILPIIENIHKFQEEFSKTFREAVEAWNEIDWVSLEGSYYKWGKYGWTLIGHAPLSLFVNEPTNEIDADKLALHFFNKKGIDTLFDELRKQKINKKDLESSIFCFNNKQYKACAMLLCAMIEAPFIRIQPTDRPRRRIGKGAVKEFNDKLDSESIEKMKFIYLHTINVLSFLMMLFDDAKDFRIEPKNLNRNFINHGMAKREVRRKDCIKLFLGLYNVSEML